ncbi:MAG: hypothetical protein V1756_00910 [Patescibacteria group bacterium]
MTKAKTIIEVLFRRDVFEERAKAVLKNLGFPNPTVGQFGGAVKLRISVQSKKLNQHIEKIEKQKLVEGAREMPG